jgi:hypothetical protein
MKIIKANYPTQDEILEWSQHIECGNCSSVLQIYFDDIVVLCPESPVYTKHYVTCPICSSRSYLEGKKTEGNNIILQIVTKRALDAQQKRPWWKRWFT